MRDTIYKETQTIAKFLKIYSEIAKDVTFRKQKISLVCLSKFKATVTNYSLNKS